MARRLLRQYSSPLVLILVFGAFVSLLLTQWTDAIIILLIVLGSTILGFTQEFRATRVIERLRDRLALVASVLRDGRVQSTDTRNIVPGDVIMLSAGDLVPADGVLLSARDFLVSQAALTGESFPVEKSPGITPETAPLIERSNVVFLGTSVRSGTAKVLVARTGQATELAAVAGRLTSDEETDFERGIRRFGYLLARIMIVMVVFAFTVNLLLERPMIDSLLFSVALAVGLTPELLPAIVSVTLSSVGPDGVASEQAFRFAAINSALETGIDNPDQAVDVARESADVVLTERDLEVLKNGVIDGRRTFANTLKYIAIATSANFGNMISMALASLFIPFLPLVAKQILLNNFLSDFPSIAMSTDNVDPHATESAQHWDIRSIQSFMLVFGLISTAFDLLTFAALRWVFEAPEPLFQST